MRVLPKVISCDAAVELMSPFIDSMVSTGEAESLGLHVSGCEACGRQLQSYISLRNIIAGVDAALVPADHQLDTRVKLSHERTRNNDRWLARIDNILKPLAVPAVMGVALTIMGFAVLLGALVSPRMVLAKSDSRIISAKPAINEPQVATYEPPRTTNPTLKRFGATMSPDLDQALSVQTELSDKGRIYDYTIIGGTRSPGVDHWLQEQLLLAQFRPATSWGIPVPSRMILSFVNVRG